jgi:hypothetical protein
MAPAAAWAGAVNFRAEVNSGEKIDMAQPRALSLGEQTPNSNCRCLCDGRAFKARHTPRHMYSPRLIFL